MPDRWPAQEKSDVDHLSMEVQITDLQAKHFTGSAPGHAQHREHRGVGFLAVADDLPYFPRTE